MKVPSLTTSFCSESNGPVNEAPLTRSSSAEIEDTSLEQVTSKVEESDEPLQMASSSTTEEFFGFYKDHYFDSVYTPANEEDQEPRSRAGTPAKFPDTLYKMLKESAEGNLEDVVSWQPHGRCFIVRKPNEFVEKIMHK